MTRVVPSSDLAPLLGRLVPIALATAMVLPACSDDDGPSGPAPNEDVIYEWSFGATELNGWEVGFASVGSSGTVVHVSADHLDDPDPDEEGSAKLDGTGDPGVPNAWIVRAGVPLPADATTLAYWAAGHNQDGANANLRVRLVDGSAVEHTLADWEEFTGSAAGRNWEERTLSIAAYAGQTVSFYFEQDDNGPGSHEQIYLDGVRILRD